MMQEKSQRHLVVRIVVTTVGGLLLIVGILGLFLPLVPGFLLILPGLAILAGEFVWARRLLDGTRARLNSGLSKARRSDK
ncbi:MAG: PGPGW domain-containing protein [Acidimicrobiia bacterium]|nr:PGPGW domain-containing protein [Acidimicrobiia bacterium]